VRGLRVGRRRLATALGAGVLLAVTAACGPEVSPLDPSLGAAFLTSEAQDKYGLTLADGVVTASAPATNTGGNTRIAFWQAADAASLDQQTCATWVNAQSELQQQGAALRVRSVNGRTTAITITDNILYFARWNFNVHVMDSGAEQPFRRIAYFDLSDAFRTQPGAFDTWPYPWRMCARVVGDTVSFIVWPLKDPEPAWDDPKYGGSVTLPAGWDQPGNPGWYVGHLEPGDSVGFTDLATADVGQQRRAGSVGREPTTPPRDPTWVPQAP
jgi:hypothetical protein